jgi:hypothetical protein
MVAVMPRQRESTQRIIATITDAGTPMTLQVSDGTVGPRSVTRGSAKAGKSGVAERFVRRATMPINAEPVGDCPGSVDGAEGGEPGDIAG